MKNMIIGLFIIVINVIVGIAVHVNWSTVLGVGCGSCIVGIGFIEYLIKKYRS